MGHCCQVLPRFLGWKITVRRFEKILKPRPRPHILLLKVNFDYFFSLNYTVFDDLEFIFIVFNNKKFSKFLC